MEKQIIITEKTKKSLIDLLESILSDYNISSYESGGCSSYTTYNLEIDLGEEDAYEFIDEVKRILKLFKGDIFETRNENINYFTQEI